MKPGRTTCCASMPCLQGISEFTFSISYRGPEAAPSTCYSELSAGIYKLILSVGESAQGLKDDMCPLCAAPACVCDMPPSPAAPECSAAFKAAASYATVDGRVLDTLYETYTTGR
jgi:hypothetical protein